MADVPRILFPFRATFKRLKVHQLCGIARFSFLQ
jgi:hypothetical protein